MPGLALAHLLGAAVMIANIGHGIDDFFAIELQNDAQNAMRARMLGPDIEEQEIRRRRGLASCPNLRAGSAALLFGVLLLIRKLKGPISVARAG